MRRRFRRWSQVKPKGELAELAAPGDTPLPTMVSATGRVLMIDGGKASSRRMRGGLRDASTCTEEWVVCSWPSSAKRCFCRATYGVGRANPSQLGPASCCAACATKPSLCGQFHRQQRGERETLPPLRHPRPGPKRVKELLAIPLDRRHPAGQSEQDRCGRRVSVRPLARQVWSYFHPVTRAGRRTESTSPVLAGHLE